MKAVNVKLAVFFFGLSFLSAGCVVRSYPLVKDRVDQDLSSGNRGYLQGQSPSAPVEKERSTTRRTQVVEVELHSPIKFERMPKRKPVGASAIVKPAEQPAEDTSMWGNRGYISQSESPATAGAEKYTVQKGDTLQKISRKFYGTTKKWNKIYQANSDVLKGPNKVYPGQVINIPVDSKGTSLKEPKTHLK